MTEVWATYVTGGWHNWPSAPEHRDYLASRHRHAFRFTATVPVSHDERDIEFHDLMDLLRASLPKDGEFGARSCETIAKDIVAYFLASGISTDYILIDVSEDGEAGASYRWTKEQA